LKQSEKIVENFCKSEAIRRGGKSFKFSSPAQRAVPDRVICLPGGRVGFLELKATGKRPTKHQQYILDYLASLGIVSGWADSKDKVKLFMDRMEGD